MSDNKYYKYCSEELAYIEVYKSARHKYFRNYPLFIAGFLACILLVSFLLSIYDSPGERTLKNEKLSLQEEFHVLNKKLSKFENQVAMLNLKEDSLYRIVLGVGALPKSIREAGFGGSGTVVSSLYQENETPNLIAKNIQVLQSKIVVLDSSMSQVLSLAYSNKDKMKHIPAIMPIYNKDLRGTGSGFGMRFHPILGIKRMHEGQDFYASTGTEVYSSGDGKIKKAYFSKTFGNVIIVDHGYGFESFYAHLSKFNIKNGQKVERGDVIGYVGNTGLSSGPHLHYEVHKNGKEVDPVNYFYADLTAEQYENIIAIAGNPDIASMD